MAAGDSNGIQGSGEVSPSASFGWAMLCDGHTVLTCPTASQLQHSHWGPALRLSPPNPKVATKDRREPLATSQQVKFRVIRENPNPESKPMVDISPFRVPLSGMSLVRLDCRAELHEDMQLEAWKGRVLVLTALALRCSRV